MELDNFLNLNLHQPSFADNIMDLQAEAEQQRLQVLESQKAQDDAERENKEEQEFKPIIDFEYDKYFTFW